MSPQPALALVAPADPIVVTRPTLFVPPLTKPGVESFPTPRDAAARLRPLIAGRPFELTVGRAAVSDFADFAAVIVRVDGAMLAVLGGPWTTSKDRGAARDELQAALA